MKIEYDIYTLSNVDGNGKERKFVKLKQHEAMTERQLTENIEQNCSLTKGDVRAVLTMLREYAVRELSGGRRFYVPELGYFSLSVGLEQDGDHPGKKIRGSDIRLRGINFRPEAKLLKEVSKGINFERSKHTSQSVKYTEETLWKKVDEYLAKERYITAKAMRFHFGLTQYSALKWLKLFVDKGLLVKDGTRHAAVYFKQ